MSTIIRSEQDYIKDLSVTDERLIQALQAGNVEMATGCLQNMAIMAGLMLDSYGDNYNEDARHRLCVNLSKTADNVTSQRKGLSVFDKDMLVDAVSLINKIMEEQGFPDLRNLFQFEDFKTYTRGILTEIANAKIGQFHNALHMQEAVIVWRQTDGMPLDYYPIPENITHIKTEPPNNPVEGGIYAFRNTLCELFEMAGNQKTKQPLISGMCKGEFDLSVREESLFIRYNGNDLKPKLNTITNVDDNQLQRACIAGCQKSCVNIDLPRQPILKI